ncbi:unnamed protein product [Arctia plantaginis]|uniref:Hemolin n=1 Tax=Arctia plantaginis TaxID=874455 RepID=A0A8S1AX59_ARCPL|nr:unnamed protein product [Arctia plantaginis]
MLLSVKCVLLVFFALVNLGECKIKRKSRSPKDEIGKSSLAFVFDVTGSMQNDLRQLREGAEMILNTAMKESNVIADFVFVPFHDPTVGPATVTRSKKVFKQALSAVHVYGGGDCPEKSLTGIQLALNVSRPRSFLYVFTDATAGDHRTVAKVLDEIQNKQSQVVFILTGHCNDLDKPSYKVYQQIAAASSGQIFNLKKASVHKMLEFVKSSIKGRTVNLASTTSPAGYNFTQEIPVDSTLGEVTVSVSGANPRITVVDPKGEQLKGPPKLITTLDLSEIMVVKVMQPEMGNYLITVGSSEDYSVKVVGLSNLTFNHGFAVYAPKSMQETSYRPLKGAYNHMKISLTQTNVTVDIQYAEILTLDGRTLFEVPLKEVDSIKKVYAAEPFIPPDEFFYIAINGRDQHNQEVRRLGTTAIKPKSPDVPHLTAPKKVEAHSHSRVVLTCNVESLVPVSTMWTKENSIVSQQTTSLRTTSLDLVIEDMKEEHVGTFSCVARNVAGISKADTELTIIVDAPQVTIEPHDATVEAGDDVTIICTVYSEALLLENKLLFNGTRTHYAIDLNKEPSLEGLYTYRKKLHVSENVTGKYSCVAANRGGKTEQSTHIIIKRNTTAQILGPHTLSKLIHSDLQLVCAVDNTNLIVWRAPNNTAVRSVVVNGTYNDVLDVRNVTSDGTWTCTALRGSMKGSDSVKVTVLIKPVVKIVGNKNITVLNGTVVEVTCLVEAKPAPRILWHRETEIFLKNTITEIKPTVYQSVLTLNSSAESVNGTYFCFGENTEGIHHDSITVNVRRKMTLVKRFTDQSVQLYYQIELHCVVDSYPPGVTNWYHNGTSLVTNDSVQISEDNTTVSLMKVDFNDLGEYICEVENEYEKLEVKGTVSAAGLARPVLYKEPVTLYAIEGRSTIITCRVLEGSPEPTITWLLPRPELRINGSFEFSTPIKDVDVNYDRYEMSIPEVTEEHAGVYRCWAHNVIGEDLYGVTLFVLYPPKLLDNTKESEKGQAVKVGERVKLSCEASGVPPPVTVWTKGGRPVVFTDKLSVTNSSELVIEAASADDSGTYTCNVTNTVGSTHKNLTLVVYDPPTISSVPSPTREVLQGQLVGLPCDAQGLPTPLVRWTLNNNPIDIKKYDDHYGLRFVANLSDSGEYTCTATNEHGNASVSYTLRVGDPPKLLEPTKEYDEPRKVKLGEGVKLSCEASGTPPPVTVWTKGGQPIVFTGKLSLTNGSELEIKAASADDSGTYTCNVTNAMGSTNKNFTLVVYDPPTISSAPTSTREVLQGQLVELPCDAQGLPTPIVHWTMKNNPIDIKKYDDQYGLRFIANVTDSGEYKCTAMNEHGDTTVSYTLHVWDPPKLLNTTKDKLQTVKMGDAVKLSCEASGTPPPVTVWTKDGRSIVFTDKLHLTTLRSVTTISDLIIESVSTYDSGEYTCNVSNAVGSTHRNFNVTVYDPPKFLRDTEEEKEPQEVKLGQRVKLSCEASGTPPPVTVWTRHGRPIAFTDKLYVQNNSELVIEAVSVEYSGIYTCNVTNAMGSIHRNFSFIFYATREVLQGQLVELPCGAQGMGTPLVRWTMNGTQISKEKYVEGYRLRFVANLTDSGEYTCTATYKNAKTTVFHILYVLDPPTFLNTTKDEPRSVKVGERVKLSCEASGVPPPVTVWTKHGRPVVFTDKLSVTNDSELVIEAASVNDSGTYTCRVTSSIGSIQRNFTLSVLDPPKLLEPMKTNDEPRKVKPGERVKLSCEASGTPPLFTVWTKGGQPIVFTDNLYLTNSSELVIDAVSPSNAGTYTCNVISYVGSTHRNFTLEVYDPPTILSQSNSLLEVLEGQLVELPCIARGVPTPIVEWTQNGEPIGHEKYFDENGMRFVANLTDFGEYSCKVTNIHGNASISYTLHVWVPPYIKPHSTVLKEALVGSNVTLQCDVIGFPLPTMQWKFNEELLEANTTDVSFNDVGNIYVTNTRLAHEGVYACVAHNLGGVDELSMYLKVNDPPKIMEDNYTGPYVATDTDTVLSVACRATGKPTPYYTWVKDGFYLNNDGRYSIDVDGTLHIKSPSEDMSGNYTCLAKNIVGVDNKTVAVEIYSLPQLTQSQEKLATVTLEEGSDAEVECPVRASSHSLKWYKNAKLISTSNLRLNNVSRDNATTYFCVAANAVGSAHSKVQLVVEWAPRFLEEENREIERVRGDDAYLHCEVDAKPSAKIKWLFNSKPLVFEDKNYLKLINVQLRHAGTYKCIVSNVRGTLVKDFTLKVLEPPFISDFDMMDVQLKEGDNATLECNAKGTPPPNVTWTYNNPHWHVEGTSLWSANISDMWAGLYRCDAVNSAGATHLVYRVTVVSAARVQEIVAYVHREGTTVGNTLELVHGSNVRVACKASGNPVPDIQWVRQGRAISENRYDIDYADLTLAGVDSSRKGLYTCVASNEGGSDDRRITLDVLEPPKIFQSLFEPTHSSEVHLEVISGQSYYLHCHPYGNPFPEVYWFRDDIPLKLFDDTMVSTEFGEVIVVKEASEDQSGNYTCVARNKVGNTSVTYLVDVLVPPISPKDSSKKVVATFGKQLVLECPSVGTRPNVMWIKHPYNEINADKKISFANDNFTMIINKTIVSDSGNYSCILTNKVGTTEVMFEVVVLKRPSIAGNVGTNIVEGHVVPLRRSIVLKCEVDGHPFPQITWLKDTQLLSDSVSNIQRVLGNSLLAIWSVEARDAGQYICLAENMAGSAHRRYNVAIQVPAKWSGWSAWSLCNVTCGLGYQTRTRLCHYIDDRNKTYDSSSNSETIVLDESACKGPSDDRRKCHMPPCQEDSSKPRWSQWSHWSECSATCGAGSQARTRKCKTKAKCVGDNVQIKKCTDLPPCSPVASSGDSDVFDSSEDISNSNPYIPDITFESEPEVVDSHYSPDVEEFYSASGAQSPTAFFDVEVKENLDGSVQGPCDPGYSHNISTNTCDDVDECTVERNQCHSTQVCMNTAGGYRCTCPAGYLALAAGQRCLDINECTLELDGCEFSCVNTAGGYVCACPRHLRLHLDRHRCVTPLPTPLRHTYVALPTPLRHTYVALPTPLRHTYVALPTPLRHTYVALPTPLRHTYVALPTPLRHTYVALPTPLRHTYVALPTPLRHTYVALPTPLRHTYVALPTPLRHTYVALPTPLRHTYVALPTPLRHTYVALPTPLRHTYVALPTPLRHTYVALPTPLRHTYVALPTPLRHTYVALPTPLRHTYVALPTPLRHTYVALPTPLRHTYVALPTPLRHTYVALPTPLRHTYVALPTPLRHTYVALPTPLRHTYVALPTPLRHTYVALPTPLRHTYVALPTPLRHTSHDTAASHVRSSTDTAASHVRSSTDTAASHVRSSTDTAASHVRKLYRPPLRHTYVALPTPLRHTYVALPTPLRHTYVALPTPLRHTYVSLPTPLRHTYVALPTPLRHKYVALPPPLRHTYATLAVLGPDDRPGRNRPECPTRSP